MITSQPERTTRGQWRHHPLLAAAALALAACGPAGEGPEVVDVDPYAAPAEEPPAIGEDAGTDDDTHAIGGGAAADDASIDIEIARYAEAIIGPANGSLVSGNVLMKEENGVVRISGVISGLSPGEHGFHVHENGDCSAGDASTAGAHFAPDGDPHGSPLAPDEQHHAGDLGNIVVANDEGVAEFEIEDPELSLDTGAYTIVGRAFVVHADKDDFESEPDGNAGLRVGCGVINITPEPNYTF